MNKCKHWLTATTRCYGYMRKIAGRGWGKRLGKCRCMWNVVALAFVLRKKVLEIESSEG